MTQGDEGKTYYILKSGNCDVMIQDAENESNFVKRLNPGDGFGEIALLYNAPRSATVKCCERCEVWVL